ncbi:MAG: type I DNA topoisomerase [Patescibacteria group bacterium]
MKLVIVESPAKTKTIGKYLGRDFTVKASVGHIRDLPKSNKKAVDVAGGFIPHYEISKGKEHVVDEIKKLAKKATEIYLATDPDREGEAIAWHVAEAIGLGSTKSQEAKTKIKRIAFNEITKTAVEEALKHPRDIDANLVKAQEARRVLDRLFGYDLSGLIWKKVRYGLSAGRVQSPALRIIMEREREIRAFVAETYYVITANVMHGKTSIILACKEEPREKTESDRIVLEGEKGKWSVTDVDTSEQKRSPRPPFITSTLQQTASTRLGLSPSRTMSLAQKLYEAGHITYMRTDSPALSADATKAISSFVLKNYGAPYAEMRAYKSKSKNAQEAHEAVRPTNVAKTSAGGNEAEQKLYELIWARAVASQMSDARLTRTTITANINDELLPKAITTHTKGRMLSGKIIPDFTATGSHVIFDGWLKADPLSRGEDVNMPPVLAGDPLSLSAINSEERATQPPSRYTEAGLVKELEKRGIGRPSTYASIIKTIEDRGYVTKEGRTLFPTDTGDVVSSFLEDHFAEYISDTFTAEMETELDDIAEGKREYAATLHAFYTPFSKEISKKDDLAKITNLGDAPEHKCPKCKGPMVIKLGRTGKFLSCKKFPDCAGARKMDGTEMEGPRDIGKPCPTCSAPLVERDGRFGRFIACSTYPKCKYVEKNEEEEAKKKTGVICPVCKKGDMMERRGRFGTFYSCSNYPKCKYAIKAKPTGKICELCGSLEMAGTKTIPERCSSKSCPNHNPHKIVQSK